MIECRKKNKKSKKIENKATDAFGENVFEEVPGRALILAQVNFHLSWKFLSRLCRSDVSINPPCASELTASITNQPETTCLIVKIAILDRKNESKNFKLSLFAIRWQLQKSPEIFCYFGFRISPPPP